MSRVAWFSFQNSPLTMEEEALSQTLIMYYVKNKDNMRGLFLQVSLGTAKGFCFESPIHCKSYGKLSESLGKPQ
jgi:hypothetical protein